MKNENRMNVSVVIPTFNCLEFLPKAIASVLSQDVERMEIIVVDDGSTDETWKWLMIEAKKDSRITPFKLNGVGVSRARNFAISKAKYSYIAFLDADDVWLPGKLSHQLGFHEKNRDIVMSFTNYQHVDLNDNNLGMCFKYWPRFYRVTSKENGFHRLDIIGAGLLFSENVVGTSTVIVSKYALQNANGFDESLNSASDWDLWLKLVIDGPVGFCNESYMIYLMRPGSISSNLLRRIKSLKLIISRYDREIGKTDRYASKFASARVASAYADYYRTQNLYGKSFHNHLESFLLAPSKRALKAAVSDIVSGFKMLCYASKV